VTGTGRSILGVDVAAEIELLSRSTLQGEWQVPVEVVRLAIRHGGRAVDIVRRRSTFTVVCRGGQPPLESLRRAAVAADPTRSFAERHEAAVALESSGDLALLWALAAPDVRVRLTLTGDAGRLEARRVRGGPVRVDRPSAGAPGVRLDIHLPGRSTGRAVDWIRAACRYAATPVSMDGEDLRVGIGEGSHRVRLDAPLPSIIHLGTNGDGPSLRLLRHELLVTRATVPGYPSFIAAVELAGVVPESASAADHRAAVTPFLPTLVDQVVGGMVRLASELPRLDRPLRTPVVRELLRAADLGLRATAVRSVPLIETVDPRGASSWRTLDELVGASGPPPAIDPRDLGRRPHGSVAVLDDESRRLAESVIGQRWPVAVAVGRRRSVRSCVASAVRVVSAALGRLRFTRRRVVAVDRLDANERRLHDVLERCAVPPGSGQASILWVEGPRPPVTRRSTLELGRDHPDVRRAVTRLTEDCDWEPVVAYALIPLCWQVRDVT